jgi:cyclic pyranopterin phosphate synthase
MFSHLDKEQQATMVNVSHKVASVRCAKASASVQLGQELMDLLNAGDIRTAKGPVFATAIVAGTMAVKKTDQLIPFCHTLPIEGCHIRISPSDEFSVYIECEVKTFAKTGVEMEALTGVSVAALTIYDMCKSVSHKIQISKIRLLEKSGGKSEYRASSYTNA